jgi:hypothetical protein
MKLENRTIYFDILALAMAVFYFVFLQNVSNARGVLGWDEAARSMGGITLVKVLTANMSFNDVISVLGVNHYYVYQGTFLYGPLHALSGALAYMLLGFSVHTARLPVALFGALAVLVTYFIARTMYTDTKIAVFAALFIVGSPIYFDFSTMNFSEIPIVFSISAGTYLLFKVKKLYNNGEIVDKNKKSYFFLLSIISGIMFSFASMTKPSAAVMGLPILIYILLSAVNKEPLKKIRRKKPEKQQNHTISKNKIIILSIPLLIMVLSVILYWSYLNSINFLQLYMNFWMGGRGYHPETEPFSLNVLLESWKPVLPMFPLPVVLLLAAGLYHFSRRKMNHEEMFLISWIAVYFFSLIASGAIAPQYPLPAIPALAIIASTVMIKIIDLYKPLDFKSHDKKWKSIIAALFILFIVLQSAMVPVYKSISLQSGNEVKGEAYNPLIIRTFLDNYIPSLYWVNTRYYNGSTIDFYARNGLDEKNIDSYHSIELSIVKDIQNNNYQTATAIFLSEDSNYFDYWFTADDKNLKYRFTSLDPRMLPQYIAQDKAPKYLVISAENEGKLIQNVTKKDNELGYSIYKMHVGSDSIQLENMNIDQIVGYK